MSAAGDDPPPGPRRAAGVPVTVVIGFLVGMVVVLVVALVLTTARDKSADPKAASGQAGATTSSPTPTGYSPSAAAMPSISATTYPGITTTLSTAGDGDPQTTSEFYVGQCVEATGTNSSFSAKPADCSGANYKIIYAFPNVSGDYDSDMSRCYSVNGNDSEFENVDSSGNYTLYCMNSLTGSYSPRRAEVNNCLDSAAAYEVDCTSSRAAWIVIGRLNGTTNTTSCSKFGSYDFSYYWSSPPSFVLCVNKYSHSQH